MSRPPCARIALLAALIASAGALGACGKTGDLQRPKPLFGHAPAAKAGGERPAGAQDPSQPVSTVDPRDVTLTPQPSRTDPVQGQSPDPMGVHPQGVLPDPYANPGR